MGLDGVRCPAHKLENIDETGPAKWMPSSVPPPETPTESMEFLARSWSVSATELSRALTTTHVVPKSFENTTFSFLGDEIDIGNPMMAAKDHVRCSPYKVSINNAQLHASISVAGVAAAVAALTASSATLAEMSTGQQKGPSKTSAAIASAAALVASHCIEIAEDMGANHDQILIAVNS